MDKIKVIAQNDEYCIIWVSGEVDAMASVVNWVGGFLVPQVGEPTMYNCMYNGPVGNTDGDIICTLSDEGIDPLAGSHTQVIKDALDMWGVDYE